MVNLIETHIERLEQCSDPIARETARQLVKALMDFHGRGLARIVDIAASKGGQELINSFANDPEIGPLFVLYDLHPSDLESRLQAALEKVRPHLAAHGGDVEFLGVADGRVRLRLKGNCGSCPSSAITLKGAVEQAIIQAAPDIDAIEVI
ncbi:MAG TPA: NifU family protein [Planctomycetota bacterium]|nr:NifU family protein [Planctomycetota bacterium]